MSHRRNANRQVPGPKQPQQQMKVRVDLSQAENISCDSCGNHTFVPVMLMKRLSPIISPTGQEEIVPIQVVSCNACGFINKEFLPISQRSEDQQSVSNQTITAKTGIITTNLNG